MSLVALTPMAAYSIVQPSYKPADVKFMQGMIAHHAQALVMTALVPSHTRRIDIRILARRITVSQQDEIALMQRWLRNHHEQVPSADLHPDSVLHEMGMSGMSHDTAHQMSMSDMMADSNHKMAMSEMMADSNHKMAMSRMMPDSAHPMLMPGMLTAAQLDELAAARGARFDRLFLQLMIQHHWGAVTMVASLFSSTGAGQDAEVFQLVSGIDADQRGEISRMKKMLAAQAPIP
jgi:uncharacterized protein (DUF305 family)